MVIHLYFISISFHAWHFLLAASQLYLFKKGQKYIASLVDTSEKERTAPEERMSESQLRAQRL